jgi:hypothetical protein
MIGAQAPFIFKLFIMKLSIVLALVCALVGLVANRLGLEEAAMMILLSLAFTSRAIYLFFANMEKG